MSFAYQDNAEWLEADGLGGFASGTATGRRTRRYHALLLPATTPPTGRVALVNGFDAWVCTPAGTCAISSQRYAPDVIHPDGAGRIESFETEPWPRWVFRLDDDTRLEQQIFVPHGTSAVVVTWRLLGGRPDVTLTVRPLLSGRDYHATHHENAALRFDAQAMGEWIRWRTYDDLPAIDSRSNGRYVHDPVWYRNFLYEAEAERGLDCIEDLASPGTLHWDLSAAEAVWILSAQRDNAASQAADQAADRLVADWRLAERARRDRFPTRLHRAADAYLVRRGSGQTIIAGYPWFTDWGRDTFIALRGLCLATGRLDDARDILLAWVETVSRGMLPNRFPDGDSDPEYNSVDASLWYVVAVHDYLRACEAAQRAVPLTERQALARALEAILAGYASGTRFGIRMDGDGLLAAGSPGVQLTWMDAKVGDWVVTPRIGKPVEIQALWFNALRIGSQFTPRWGDLADHCQDAFGRRFWNADQGFLFDVVDVDHQAGQTDATMRPNQIFAVGGLPFPLLAGDRARRIVDAVERTLLTPLGLRTLAPGLPGYAPRCVGDQRQRDGAYHQGTAWPWLLGPFVEAWLRVHGDTDGARQAARQRFLTPLLEHLDVAGLGHVSEIADADPPHTPRGCPFQAWSVGEVLRLAQCRSSSR